MPPALLPLLRRLLLEAPGTYHHAIVVANLAEAAAEKSSFPVRRKRSPTAKPPIPLAFSSPC